MRYTFAILLVSSCCLLSACFHKSDTTGSADDVEQSFICGAPNGEYLVTHEKIFHATSKSSGPKGSFTSGYADYRYTVRDIQTGAQVARITTGDDEDDVIPLGYDGGGNVWCYGADEKTGLHARNAATMQVSTTRQQIETANPGLAGKLAMPKRNEADNYYGYDAATNNVLLTDMQGNRYSMNTTTLKAETTNSKLTTFSFYHASSSRAFNGKEEVSLEGDLRKQVQLSEGSLSKDSYLNGAILLEQNMGSVMNMVQKMKEGYKAKVKQKQHELDSMLQQYPALKDEQQAYPTIKDHHIPDYYYHQSKKLGELIEDSNDKADHIMKDVQRLALGADPNTLYIAHALNTSDTSSLCISKLSINNGLTTTVWTTTVPQVYFDPEKGIKKNRMADVFKAGNPSFDYEWYSVDGNVLVGIKMLFAFGINTETGKVMWKQQL